MKREMTIIYPEELEEKLEHITVKIVGFRVGHDRAVFYKKLDTPSDKDFGKWMNIAFHDRNCDFISIRKI